MENKPVGRKVRNMSSFGVPARSQAQGHQGLLELLLAVTGQGGQGGILVKWPVHHRTT